MPRKLSGTIRRWFQFRLTTFLMFVAVVAMALGWWSDRRRSETEIKKRDALIAVLRMGAADPDHLTLPAWAFVSLDSNADWKFARALELLDWARTGTNPRDNATVSSEPVSDVDAIRELHKLLHHANPQVRGRAAVALTDSAGRSPNAGELTETLNELMEAFRAETDDEARKVIGRAAYAFDLEITQRR
jgi:hypothetical protein